MAPGLGWRSRGHWPACTADRCDCARSSAPERSFVCRCLATAPKHERKCPPQPETTRAFYRAAGVRPHATTRRPGLAAALKNLVKYPAHFGLAFLDPSFERGEVRSIAGS